MARKSSVIVAHFLFHYSYVFSITIKRINLQFFWSERPVFLTLYPSAWESQMYWLIYQSNLHETVLLHFQQISLLHLNPYFYLVSNARKPMMFIQGNFWIYQKLLSQSQLFHLLHKGNNCCLWRNGMQEWIPFHELGYFAPALLWLYFGIKFELFALTC